VEDAWSETFAAALAAYPRLRPDSSIRGRWSPLPTTEPSTRCVLAAGSRYRSTHYPSAPLLAPNPLTLTATSGAAVAGQPTKQRGAAVYQYIAGLPYAEVAALLASTERLPAGPPPTAWPPSAAPSARRTDHDRHRAPSPSGAANRNHP